MADNALVRILTALLKHQVKKFAGADALGAIGEELTAIGGDELAKQIKIMLGEKSTTEELEKAAVAARESFRGKVNDDEIEQWMVMLPLDNLPTVVSALEELPNSPDESKLENALRETVSINWQKLSIEQVNNAVDSYLSCLRSALLPIEEQRLMVIGRSVLRTEEQVKQLISLFNKYIINADLNISSDVSRHRYKQSWDVSTERYRQRIKELHSKIRILNKESVHIDSFYVELSVISGLSSRRHYSINELDRDFKGSRIFSKHEKGINVSDLIDQKDKIFLSGKPGSGKTISLKHITVLAAEKKIKKLPIFISLTDLGNNPQGLMQYIIGQFELCDFPDAELYIEASLKKGKIIVLFDGFDEVLEENGQREQVQKEIVRFVDKYPDNKFVISCRNAASNYQFNDFAYFEISDFDEDQVGSYIRNWFDIDQITASQFVEQLQQPRHWNIKELTQNPLLLNLLCIVFEETKKIPAKKSDLYRKAMDCLLQKWDESKGIKRDQIYRVLSLKNKKKLLAHLAFEFSTQGTVFFDQDKAAALVVDFLTTSKLKHNKDDIVGNVVLSAMEAQHGLITKRAEYVLSFSHLSFQEYFTSRHIVETNTNSVFREYFSHIDDDNWEEIFLLTSGMQENTDSYFKKFSRAVNSKVSHDKKLENILKWADEKRQESYQNIHPALERMIALKTLLNIDSVVDQVRPDVSSKDYLVAENLAKFLHLDTKIDIELSTLADIANCIALNKPLNKTLKNELVRALKVAENRADFYQEGPSNKNDFNFEQARGKIRNYILSLDHETKQQFKVNLDKIWSDDMVRDFSDALNINLSEITTTFINKERILANNRLPKQNANNSEWNSFRQGLKKDILGDKSLLYDLSMSEDQRTKVINFLRANILLARCLHVSDTINVTNFENSLIWLQKIKK